MGAIMIDYTDMKCSKSQAIKCLGAHGLEEVLDCGDHIAVTSEYVTESGAIGQEVATFLPDESGRYPVQILRDFLGY